MPLPDCHGKDCRKVSYEIRNYEFRGAVLNADKPENERVTTPADRLNPGAREGWTRDTEANLRTMWNEQAAKESTPCSGTCRCAAERTSETEFIEARHEYQVTAADTNTLAAIGVATYEYRRVQVDGKCLAPQTTASISASSEFLAVYVAKTRRDGKGKKGRDA